MSENGREPWATEAYAAYQKYRGPFGPIIANEVEAAFFDALQRGMQQGYKQRQIAFGPPPWKAEDAFEVYFERAKERVMMPVEELFNEKTQAHKISRDAFLAGAEYGAAAGSEADGEASENRTDGAPLGGRGASSEAGSRKRTLCNVLAPGITIDPPEGSLCTFDRGHMGKHSWCLPCPPAGDTCGARRTFSYGTLFCELERGHGCDHRFAPEGGWPTDPADEAGDTPAILSREEWKLERCRSLVFAILGGLSAVPTPTGHLGADLAALRQHNDDIDPVGDYINELRELWQTM